jgi:hypothetical protein
MIRLQSTTADRRYGELKLVQLFDAWEFDLFRPVLKLALEEIGARSGGRYAADVVLDRLRNVELPNDNFALVICIDSALVQPPAPAHLAVCGVLTLNVVGGDEVGMPVAFLSRGWIRRGYGGEPFDAALPLVKKWAVARGCRRLMSMTERSSAAAADRRLEIGDRRVWNARMKALRAYAKWIGARGFEMRETIFELELEQ